MTGKTCWPFFCLRLRRIISAAILSVFRIVTCASPGAVSVWMSRCAGLIWRKELKSLFLRLQTYLFCEMIWFLLSCSRRQSIKVSGRYDGYSTVKQLCVMSGFRFSFSVRSHRFFPFVSHNWAFTSTFCWLWSKRCTTCTLSVSAFHCMCVGSQASLQAK